jgi:hypothetical protein
VSSDGPTLATGDDAAAVEEMTAAAAEVGE